MKCVTKLYKHNLKNCPGSQQQSKMVSKISRSQDFIGISGFIWDFNLWISRFLWDLWDFYGIISVFYGNNRNKYIAWDFGSRIQARFQLRFQYLRPRFQLVADPSELSQEVSQLVGSTSHVGMANSCYSYMKSKVKDNNPQGSTINIPGAHNDMCAFV